MGAGVLRRAWSNFLWKDCCDDVIAFRTKRLGVCENSISRSRSTLLRTQRNHTTGTALACRPL